MVRCGSLYDDIDPTTGVVIKEAKRKTGLIGTVEIRYGNHHESAVNTTPESLDLQRTLRAMRNEGIDAAVMEVSSHGLELTVLQDSQQLDLQLRRSGCNLVKEQCPSVGLQKLAHPLFCCMCVV